MGIVMIYKDGTVQIWSAESGENVDIFENCQKLIQRAILDIEGKIILLMSNRGSLIYIN